jgi:hypothetical protein
MYKDLKKGDEVRTIQLGPPVSGKLLESPVQGRGVKKAILIMSNGSEVGAFNDHGSVYAEDVTEVKREGSWQQVTDQPKNAFKL